MKLFKWKAMGTSGEIEALSEKEARIELILVAREVGYLKDKEQTKIELKEIFRSKK